MTPWYAYAGGSAATLALLTFAVHTARGLVRWGGRVAARLDELLELLREWPTASQTLERHDAELVEFGVALGRIDGAQRRNRRDLNELWRLYRAEHPNPPPLERVPAHESES